MAFEYIHKIPEISKMIEDMPLDDDLKRIKETRDEEIKAVFESRDERLILIIGPCSADNEDAVCEYISRLCKLQDKVKEKLLMIPRIYTNKPRTTGKGYKGMAHQPDPREEPNIVEGVKAIRRMHIRSLRETHMSAADEMLYPGNYPCLEDLLSYVAIGARSVENQQHRLTVSGLDIPIGMKNPISGDLQVMLNSVFAAQIPHSFIYNGWEVKTTGNDLAHSIVRGSVDHYGRNIPNHHYEDLMMVSNLYEEITLNNPALIVDTNHSNSGKMYKEQPRIAMEVLNSMKRSDRIKGLVKGFMIESYIEEGSQNIMDDVYGRSITDPCLGWEDTEKMVCEIAEAYAAM